MPLWSIAAFIIHKQKGLYRREFEDQTCVKSAATDDLSLETLSRSCTVAAAKQSS